MIEKDINTRIENLDLFDRNVDGTNYGIDYILSFAINLSNNS